MDSTAPGPALAFADAFEPMRLRLFGAGLLGASTASNSLALTAMGRGDGVSTVAIGCAIATARRGDGAVLLVDGTPLGERCGRLLGANATSLTVDAGLDRLDAAIVPVPGIGLHLLQLASAPPGAGDSAAAMAWAALWAELTTRYRHVIVDAGSLKSDAPQRWSGWAAHTALVIDTTRVTREAMEALRRELRHGGPELAGFILNKRTFHVPARLYRALS